MKKIDARGLACPAPVLLAKEIIEAENPELFEIQVDNAASEQNVRRFLSSRHFEAITEKIDGDLHITAKRLDAGAITADKPKAESRSEGEKILVMIPTDRMGFGDDALGLKLMVNYINTLKEMGSDLWRLILVNNGVKMAIEGSAVLETLLAYERNGLKILVCGTCLDHFGLLEKKAVGETTNMLDIVTAMQLADKVISL